jgi:aryl-alcohol dehydrogenase-like predicted oxidoreductase
MASNGRQASAAASGSFSIGGDLPVHRLGYGDMRLPGPGEWGEPPDRARALAVLRRVVELGVTLIDTADAYGPEVSERLLAEALSPYPEGLVIASKGGYLRPSPRDWVLNGRPEHLRAALDGSLQRLRLERIDLYQLHGVDPEVPIEESVGALADARAAGKIRHVGLSNVTLDELRRAQRVVPIVSVQNRYNLADRRSDELVDVCAAEGLAFIPFAPLGAGALPRAGGALQAVAQRLGATASQVALTWLLRRSPAMLPIPGTSSVAHLEENVGAAALHLSDEDFAALGA